MRMYPPVFALVGVGVPVGVIVGVPVGVIGILKWNRIKKLGYHKLWPSSFSYFSLRPWNATSQGPS